jgi:hypothetical protein
MNHGETFAQQFQAVDRILALVEKVCVRQGIDLNIIADIKTTEIVALSTDDLNDLADKYGQMIGAQETGHSRVRPMLDVTPRASGSNVSRQIEATKRRIDAMMADVGAEEEEGERWCC